MFGRERGDTGITVHFWWIIEWCGHCGKWYVIPKKPNNRICICCKNPTSEYAPKRRKSRDSRRYLHTHAYSSLNHRSPGWNLPNVRHGRLQRQNVVHAPNGMLFGLEEQI